MAKVIHTSQKSLFDQSKEQKVIDFLKSVPYLTFSEKGLSNIANRFDIDQSRLQQLIQEFEGKEGPADG